MTGKTSANAVRRAGWVLLAVVMLLMAACGGSEPPTADPPTQPSNTITTGQPPGSAALPASPAASVEPALTAAPAPEQCAANAEVVGVVSHSGLIGPGIIDVTVRNPQNTPLTVGFQPGCVFLPPADSPLQRMMVLQATEVELAAGETTTVSPYVAGIDASADVPAEGAAYSLGGMVPDVQLQQLAECLNGQPLPANGADNEGLGVQFAVWQISSGYSLVEFREQVAAGNVNEESLGGVPPEQANELLLPLLDELIASSQHWLTLCPVAAQ